MSNFIRCNLLLLCLTLFYSKAVAQCNGLPPVASLGSNKFPAGLCSPVRADVTYNVTFTSPVSTGKLELVYDWGDGSPAEVLPLEIGRSSYSSALPHQFPAESDCEYFVTIAIRLNGVYCTSTRQVQKIASWRPDAYNGGRVQLISPVTNTPTHIVCEGTDIDVILKDESQFNCNSNYVQQPPNAIESPNHEGRWQQIVYNTSPANGGKIPNVSIDGIHVTGDAGADIRSHYQDPRGVHYMASPVLVNDGRRRPSLRITAPGGFDAGYPKVGDVFQVTIRYWNFCNPYDDPNIPGPPADLVNGDHPPVENTAVIQIQAAPAALTATDETVCNGTTPAAFAVSGATLGSTIRWYAHDPVTGKAGALLAAKSATTFPVTSHPDWKNNTTAGALKIWASQEPKIAGSLHCESPKTLITRTITESITVSEPLTPVPSAVCNSSSVTITMPAPATELVGGATYYTWSGSAGVAVTSTTENSATFALGITNFGGALYVDRTITVRRRYKQDPACGKSRVFTLRIYKNAVGGQLSETADVCETAEVPPLSVYNYSGQIVQWEVKKDQGEFEIQPASAVETFRAGKLPHGIYTFRALISNGPCASVYSGEEQVQVFQQPDVPVFAGNDQFICTSLSSVALGASNPAPGTGTWSYISSVPAKLRAPVFSPNVHDPNAIISIEAADAGAYTLRWTVSNGSCIMHDDVVVDFGTDPTVPNAGADQQVCADNTVLDGNAPEKGLGTWTIISGPGNCTGNNCGLAIEKPSSPAATVKLKSPAIYGTYHLRWTISSGGNNCFVKHDDVLVTFDKAAALAASDITGVCLDAENLSPIALTGTVDGATTAAWVANTGHGTVGASTTTGSTTMTVRSSYTPSYEDYMSGKPVTVKLTATHQASSSCAEVSKVVTIDFDRKPIASPIETLSAICGDTVKLKKPALQFGATGEWSSSNSSLSFDDPRSPETVVRNLPPAPSETTVQWTMKSARGYCVSEPAIVNLHRVQPPDAINSTAFGCADSHQENASTSVVLRHYDDQVSTLPAQERMITWYEVSGDKLTPVASPENVKNNVPHNQLYIANVRDLKTNCSRDAELTVKVRPLPHVRDAIRQLCETVAGSLEAKGVDLSDKTYKDAVTQSSDVVVSWHATAEDAYHNTSSITAPVDVKERKQFYARVTRTGVAPACHAVARLELVVKPKPSQTTISGRETVCLSSAGGSDQLPVEIYQVTPLTGAKYYWEIPQAQGESKVFSGGKENDFFVMLQFLKAFTGKIRLRVELNGCSGILLEKEITVSDAAPVPVITGPDAVCENDHDISFAVASPQSSTYAWSIRRAADNSEGGAVLYGGSSASNVRIDFLSEDVLLTVRETNAGCASVGSATKTIKVNTRPKVHVTTDHTLTEIAGQGTIRTTVSKGVAPFTYVLLPKGTVSNDGVFYGLDNGSYQVEVTGSNGCSTLSDVIVINHAKAPEQDTPITIGFNATPMASCSPTTIEIINTTRGADVYQWRLYEGNKLVTTSNLVTPAFSVAKPGTYTLQLQAGSSLTGTRDSLTLTGIEVFASPGAMFMVRTPVLTGTALQIINRSEFADHYTWDFGDGNTAYDVQPKYTYTRAGDYSITLVASKHYRTQGVSTNELQTKVVCADSATQHITVEEGAIIYAPNAFTPNTSGPTGGVASGSGYNDVFSPVVKNVTDFNMRIFDRWGTLLFESNDQRVGWDGYNREGKLMPAGVYVYKLQVTHESGEQTMKLGDITLIK